MPLCNTHIYKPVIIGKLIFPSNHLQDFYLKEGSTEDLPPPEGEDDNCSSGGDHRRQGSNGSSHSTDANRNPVPAANGDRGIPAPPAVSPGVGVGVREVPYKRSSSAGRDVKGSSKAEVQDQHRRNRSAERSNSLGTGDKRVSLFIYITWLRSLSSFGTICTSYDGLTNVGPPM